MDTIGGFRLVRRLGAGTRAEVHLGHAASGADGRPRTAAVKVFRPETPIASIETEIEALARASSQFLLRLDDLTMTLDDVPVLILQRLGPTTLSRLCLERERMSPGEAVTIVAPLADAVAELHRVGVAHQNLRLSTVHFDDAGAPVLLGFGSATIIGPLPLDEGHSLTVAERDSRPAVVKDLDDLRTLARTVIECSAPSPERSRLVEWLASDILDPSTFCDQLRERMFDFAAPTAVEFRAGSIDRSPRAVPVREVELEDPLALRPWLATLNLPAWLDELVPRRRARERKGTEAASTGGVPDVATEGSPRSVVGRVRAFFAPVRRPVWITAGLVAALMIAAITVVGTGDRPSAGATSPSGPDAASTDAGDRPASSPAPSAAPTAGGDDAAIRGDDPVEAVRALLVERASCFDEKSILCLDGVDQTGSAAMEADAYAINSTTAADTSGTAAAESGGPPDLTLATPVLTELIGGSALIGLDFTAIAPSGPPVTASVLVVKGDSGWRIRDLVIG